MGEFERFKQMEMNPPSLSPLPEKPKICQLVFIVDGGGSSGEQAKFLFPGLNTIASLKNIKGTCIAI